MIVFEKYEFLNNELLTATSRNVFYIFLTWTGIYNVIYLFTWSCPHLLEIVIEVGVWKNLFSRGRPLGGQQEGAIEFLG